MADIKLIDLELVKQVKSGNKTAFNILVRTHQRGVYAIVFSMVKDHDATDDIVQDTFVKAYKHIESFEAKSSFKSWLYSIAINNAKNALKSESLREMVDLEKVVLHVTPRMSENLETQQLQSILAEEIEKLPAKQKMALTLRIFDELPFKEIAQIMECPYDTAKANFRHAINNLRKQSRILDVA
ncbi:MAG: sigma-70 family RNA polymerase sigma factor [Pseudomonadota bacterium]